MKSSQLYKALNFFIMQLFTHIVIMQPAQIPIQPNLATILNVINQRNLKKHILQKTESLKQDKSMQMTISLIIVMSLYTFSNTFSFFLEPLLYPNSSQPPSAILLTMTCMFAFNHFKSTVHNFHILPILLGTMSQTMQMKGKGCYWFLYIFPLLNTLEQSQSQAHIQNPGQ